jgi:hypothetical protein
MAMSDVLVRQQNGGACGTLACPRAGRDRAPAGTTRAWAVRGALVSLLAIHAGLLAYGAWRHSFTWDEIGHLPAGLSHWRTGTFVLYRVNPPLVRMIAALPALVAGAQSWWGPLPKHPGARPEFYPAGAEFLKLNGERSFRLLTLARWACIPFSLLGGYLCFRWARELYGSGAGLLAACLWCFSPNILAHGQLITPDAGATALGLAAAYLFWRWLKAPTWPRALAAGLVLGLAELSKTTWVVLFALWPALWLVWNLPCRREMAWPTWRAQAWQLAAVLLLGLYLIHVGYGFEGSFKRLGDFEFESPTLTGASPAATTDRFGNRFANTWLARVPLPLPENYVHGIDSQKRDFDRRMWSYFRGQWRLGGWWHYYLYALAIKVPLGTWCLVAAAAGLALFRRTYLAPWRDEMMLLAPAAVVLALVSSQTGFSHHLRYVLSIFPFVFIWTSKVAQAVQGRNWALVALVGAALSWSVGRSLWHYPHSLSYFNELVGGPAGGHWHLGDSNIDWGQDLLDLKRWLDEHPEAKPLRLAPFIPEGLFNPRIAGIEAERPPAGPCAATAGTPAERVGPLPGWFALSINRVHACGGEYEYFLRFEPQAMIGYSIYIYHITPEAADRVRAELGLPPLPSVAARVTGTVP